MEDRSGWTAKYRKTETEVSDVINKKIHEREMGKDGSTIPENIEIVEIVGM